MKAELIKTNNDFSEVTILLVSEGLLDKMVLELFREKKTKIEVTL
jgi:hypothetical protein